MIPHSTGTDTDQKEIFSSIYVPLHIMRLMLLFPGEAEQLRFVHIFGADCGQIVHSFVTSYTVNFDTCVIFWSDTST